MSLLNQNKNKGNKKNGGKADNKNQGSKFIKKPKQGFVSKQQNTGSQRGS
jgi:hypothetical protein